ncbi:MAG: tripartite tricarboxylate transporter permease, partial [Paracoccus sp. (in: a-proteobacteria)]|nr:tripartite tricarboxylate transporter permease [Paracoccus sp. (in: a-proteobacteria)]
MSGVFDNILAALPLVFSVDVMIAMIVGTMIGIAVGALPGLSATMGIAVLIPLTFAMDPLAALGMIAGIYNGAMYGGAIPAILLRIPGTPAAIATVFDGYAMARKGQAQRALDISLVSSAIGGSVSALALLFLAPPLAAVALKFSPADYFWLAIFGLSAISVMLSANLAKGFLGVSLGLILGTVGIDAITGAERYVFDNVNLLSGVNIIVFLTGLYAIPPAIDLIRGKLGTQKDVGHIDVPSDKAGGFSWSSLVPTWARSSGIGVVAGLIPGLGGNIAALLAWNAQGRFTKAPALYGAPDGLAAPETANNADNGTSLVPALTLGVPGNAVAAIIMGSMLVHGLRPGPELFRDNADVVYGFMLAMLITCGLMLVIGKL